VSYKDASSIYNMPRVVVMTLSGSLGGLSVGYNLGIVAAAMLYLDQVYDDLTTISKSVRSIKE
jgi:hypothetical protein